MGKARRVLREYWPVYAGAGVYLLLDLRCPVLSLLHIPCPTCGVTRAMWALLRLDLAGYVHYNWMAPFLASAVLLYLHRAFLRDQRLVTAYTVTVLGVNSVRYVCLLAGMWRP